MNKKELEVVIQRIEKWYKHLYEMVVYKKTTFNADTETSKSPESPPWLHSECPVEGKAVT